MEPGITGHIADRCRKCAGKDAFDAVASEDIHARISPTFFPIFPSLPLGVLCFTTGSVYKKINHRIINDTTW